MTNLPYVSTPPRIMAHDMMATLHYTGGDEGDIVAALLLAMREPTPEMIAAAQAARAVVTNPGPDVDWIAMIDYIHSELRA
mgnify:CR=1 FL=1